MYIQIQEGHLLPNGHIDENSIKWVPIQEGTCDSSGKTSFSVDYILYFQRNFHNYSNILHISYILKLLL